MTYDTAKKLKEAGFPQNHPNWDADLRFCPDCISESDEGGEMAHLPTLEELIAACADGFLSLNLERPQDAHPKKWRAQYAANPEMVYYGSTPEEAVANLWLVLHAN